MWNAGNQVKVPIGNWFTLEYYLKEGNKETGRAYVTITPNGEAKQVVFDVTNFMHNIYDPAQWFYGMESAKIIHVKRSG